MSNLLTLIQRCCGQMGLLQPAFVVGNTTATAVQLLALANAVGDELMSSYDWQALHIEYRFDTEFLSTTGDGADGSTILTNLSSATGLDTTYEVTGPGIPQDCYVVSVDSATQVTLNQPLTATTASGTFVFGKTQYALPEDWDRPVNRTQWDKTRHWEMLGPCSAQLWQWLKSGYIATGPRIQYRLLGGKFQFWPIVTAAEYLAMEYISNKWAQSSSGTAQTMFEADTDTCIFRDALMIAGIKLKYFQLKGFDTTAYQKDYDRILAGCLGGDAGAATLHMAGRPLNVLINLSNVPDSNYGATN